MENCKLQKEWHRQMVNEIKGNKENIEQRLLLEWFRQVVRYDYWPEPSEIGAQPEGNT